MDCRDIKPPNFQLVVSQFITGKLGPKKTDSGSYLWVLFLSAIDRDDQSRHRLSFPTTQGITVTLIRTQN
jgi:hypothetical protein